MKCLPASKVSSSKGRVLHDWHAEILCIRAFNVFLLDECKAVASGSRGSEYINRRSPPTATSRSEDDLAAPWRGQPFEWNDHISLHMYSSEAPCETPPYEPTAAHRSPAAS